MEVLKRAVEAHQSGQLTIAKQLYKEILSSEPQQPDALHLLGLVCMHEGDLEESIGLIQRAINEKSEVALYHSNLGNAYSSRFDFEKANQEFERAVELNPGYRDAYYNWAVNLQRQSKLSESNEKLTKCVNLDQKFWPAFTTLANNHIRLGELAMAEEFVRAALKLNPQYAPAFSSYGTLEFERSNLDKAKAYHLKAIELSPDFFQAYCNLGLVEYELGQLDLAEKAFRKALDIEPSSAEAHSNLSHLLLLEGRFEEAWSELRWTWRKSEKMASLAPGHFLERSIDFTGKKLLVLANEGFGDIFQNIRYLPYLSQLASEVSIKLPSSLKPLLESQIEPYARIVSSEKSVEYDYFLPMEWLHAIMYERGQFNEPRNNYLKVASDLVENWKHNFKSSSKLKVGLAWRGNPTYFFDQWRSLHFEQIKCLFEVEEVDFYSLQKTDENTEPESFQNFFDFSQELDQGGRSFKDTAAVIESLDLVISTDTAIAHLAGAMGKECWLLLKHTPDWRWGLESDESRCYSSFKLYRQPSREDWESVFHQVKQDLKGRTKGQQD